ncbi:MAG TPA: serine protease [Sporichthya sp.]|nr:serine protease [Sporichthya sp.]
MRFRPAALAAAVLIATGLAPMDSASAAGPPAWAPIDSAAIHPGTPTVSGDAGCTANFVYIDKTGAVYIGQAAHCTSTSEELVSANGCTTGSLPLGTSVSLGPSGVTGTLAYSSWLTMQKVGEKDETTCLSNDLALVKIPPSAVSMVNPSVPVFGGPVGVSSGEAEIGERVYGYGSSDLRGGIETPQQGLVIETEPGSWSHLVYLLPPGVPGDSGGGLLDGQGRAFGILASLNTLPPASNGVCDFAKALAYAQAHSGIKGLELVPGTEPFSG